MEHFLNLMAKNYGVFGVQENLKKRVKMSCERKNLAIARNQSRKLMIIFHEG